MQGIQSIRRPPDKTTATPDAQLLMAERLQLALDGLSHRTIARDVGFVPETIRRYRNTGTPSWLFLCAITLKYGISAEWLLTGIGPMMDCDKDKFVLEHISTEILLSELSKRIDGESRSDASKVMLKEEVLRKIHPRHQRRAHE